MSEMPVLDRPPVVLPTLIVEHERLWGALFDIAERAVGRWCLVGGQMVLLHALEHGAPPLRASRDLDLLIDVRVDRRGLRKFATMLGALDFTPIGMSPTGTAHRYVNGDGRSAVVVDVLAPDGLGPRADLVTTPPGTTVEMPAGTRTLQRAQRLPVTYAGRNVSIPRPDLLGAIIAKAAAAANDREAARHYNDLAFLCCLVPDPFDLAKEITPKDRQRLRHAHGLEDARHEAWRALEADRRERGITTYQVLSRSLS